MVNKIKTFKQLYNLLIFESKFPRKNMKTYLIKRLKEFKNLEELEVYDSSYLVMGIIARKEYKEIFWYQKYLGVLSYIKKYTKIPTAPNKFGRWLSKLRSQYRNSLLSNFKIKLLIKIPGWKWEVHEEQWMINYLKIKNLLIKNKNYPSKGKSSLGTWVVSQRIQYRKKLLNKNQISLLEKLPNWAWELSDHLWLKKYNELKDLLKISKVYPNKRGDKLFHWCMAQKERFKKKILPKERVSLLEKLPNWSWKHDLDKKWMDKYNKLKHYIKLYKSFPIKSSDRDLNVWLFIQRQSFRKKKINKKRAQLLEKLPNWTWFPLEDIWTVNYVKLKSYINKFNSLPVMKEGNSLGYWVSSQREKYKKGQLNKHKISLLERLSVWSWNKYNNEWSIKYVELKQYLKTHKKYPSQKEHKLGWWVNRQRIKYRNNRLDQEYIKLLEKLLGWKWEG